MRPMVLDTPRQLYEHSHQLAAHCPECRSWRELTLSDFTDWGELIAALRAFPELEIAAGEVLYQSIANRASMETMRRAALDLRATLEQWLISGK